MTPPPEPVTLTSEEGAALIDRVYASNLPRADCTVLVQIVRLHFWLLPAIQEAKLSLKRFRQMLFGESTTGRAASVSSAPSREAEKSQPNESPAEDKGQASRVPRQRGGHRPGQGRLSADVYVGAERIECRHDTLSPGDRCPVCGYGNLYRLPAGTAIRINGNPLLSVIRYELEKLRCSACGTIFGAKLPDGVGADKYSPRARAALAFGRYLLGLPFYRLGSY